MERRAYPRLPLNLNAMVTQAGARSRGCRVRDFCRGGMFLVCGQQSGGLGVSLTPPFNVGDAVDVNFSLRVRSAIPGERRTFRLAARVVRVLEHGMGVAFSAPDAAAILALEDLAQRPQTTAAPQRPAETGEASPPAVGAAAQPGTAAPGPEAGPAIQVEGVLDAVRQAVSDRLPAMLEEFFAKVSDRLVTHARSARNNAEQTAYFDAITELKKLRSHIESLFRDAILEQTTDFANPMAADPRVDGLDGGEGLSLVDQGEFEDWVAVAGLITKAEAEYRQRLYEIEQRLGRLTGSGVDKESNPVGPATICRSFRGALSGVSKDRGVRDVIYRVFSDSVVGRLGDFYDELNRVLVDSGVELPSQPRRSAAAPTPAPAAAAPQAPQAEATAESEFEPQMATAPGSMPGAAVVGPGAPPGAAPDAYQTARELLHLRRELSERAASGLGQERSATGKGTPAAAGGSGAVGPETGSEFRPYDVAEILEAVAQFGHLPSTNLRSGLLAALAQRQGPVASRRRLGPRESDVLDVLQTLFQELLGDTILGEGVKPALRRLDRPLLRLAMEDDSFLGSPSHPARRVLDQLYRLAIAASDDGDEGLRQVIEQLTERLASHPRADSGAFREVLAELDGLVQRQDKLHLRNVERVVRACEGKQRSEMAGRAVGEALDQRLAGRRVPAVVLGLLDAGWRALLRLTHTREGQDSDAWGRYLNALDRLLGMLTQVGKPGWRPDPEAEPLLQLLERGLSEVCFDQFRCNKVMQDLRGLLTPRPDGGAPSPPEMVVAPESAPPNPLAAVDLAQESLGEWLNQARQLQVGEWVLIDGADGQKEPLKLAWVATDRTEYVFVNRKGLKVVSLGPVEVAERLRDRRISVLGERDKPVMDRAMQDMLQQMSQQLVFQATHDQLTSLVNRKEFGKRLDQALISAKQGGSEHVLCHMDLDQFKVINTVCGHDAGDALLREVARLLEAQIPEGGVLARLGDDEFSILLSPCSQQEGTQIAERQRIAVQDYRFVWEGKRYSVGASIGLVLVNQQSPGAAELLQQASSACDTAKEAGGNRIHVYQADDAELRRRQGVMQWLTRIARALDDDRLQLRCQQIAPVVPAAGPAEVHYEILLSFRDEEGRLTAPGEFIEAAELYHRMADVDRWVIRKVFRWMAERRSRLDQFGGFAINLSGNSLNDPNFSTFVLEQLAAADIPAERVCFEITETAAIANLGLAAEFIREIKHTGCRFSLDDFGSGLSSYSYLKNLPVDFLKIDGMFVRDIVNSANDYAVVKSINEIGHFMGMKTIAEHVETAEILERLRQIGVDYAQGNGVERPRLLAAY